VADTVKAPRIAPLSKRCLASLVETVPWLLMALPFLIESRRGSTRRPRRELQLAGTAFADAYQISLTGAIGQTLGQMVVGIRVVDAKTSTVPTLKQAVLRWAVASVPGGLFWLLGTFIKVEEPRGLMELQPEVDRLNQCHRGDPQSLNEALMALYKEHNVNPVEGCLPVLLQVLAALVSSCLLYGPALKGPLHQGLHDRAAGTVVVDVHKPFGRR
jgi:uncharacterized RDD family membrane protein YckC